MGLFKKASSTFSGELQTLTFEETKWNSDAAAKKAGAKPYSTISMVLSIDKDGADEPIKQFLEAGFFYPDRGQTISEDGTTLEGGGGVGEDTESAAFIQSAIDKGVDPATLVDGDGNGTNFAVLTGQRYEFGRAINVRKQMASGRKKLGIKDSKGYTGKLGKEYTEAEVMTAGRKQDAKDKSIFYNQTYLVIEDILGEKAAAAPAPKAAAAKKTVAAPAAATKTVAKGGKPNGKAVEVPVDYETADSLLVTALADAKNSTLKKASLSSVAVKWAVENDKTNEERDEIRNLFADDTYLGREQGWKFDVEGKDKPVSLGA